MIVNCSGYVSVKKKKYNTIYSILIIILHDKCRIFKSITITTGIDDYCDECVPWRFVFIAFIYALQKIDLVMTHNKTVLLNLIAHQYA